MIEAASLALRVMNTPLAMDARGVDLVRSIGSEVNASYPGLAAPRQTTSADRGYTILNNNIAIIEISGFLVHSLSSSRPAFGMTGYNGIRFAIQSALKDRRIEGIILDINSVGGEISGLFDLVDGIYNARGIKPIHAILTESALSAAYAIASAADHISVPRTGWAGSIGIIVILADCSQALRSSGVNINVVKFGNRKADGLSEIPLSNRARSRFQSEVNILGNLFVRTVARNRKINRSAVMNTDGSSYLGGGAIKLGLVDKVCSPDDAFSLLNATVKAKLRKKISR